jgi:ribosomal protein S18 acetylase RimI-like enzyme
MTKVVTIRQAESKDRNALELCFDELQSFERSIELNRSEPQSICGRYIDGLFADCAKTSGAIFVAEVDGLIVGFVCVLSRVPSDNIIELESEYAYVTDLVVLEPFQRSGFGVKLMQAAEVHAVESGATRIRVGVLAANLGAHRLYRKLGCSDSEIVLEKRITQKQPNKQLERATEKCSRSAAGR